VLVWYRGGVDEGWLERRFFRNFRPKRGLLISGPTAKDSSELNAEERIYTHGGVC
jgi:hypothetical protein